MTTVVPDLWDELALIDILPQGGSAIAFGALTEDITAMDWGEKDIESLPMISGGNVTKKTPMTQESITFKMMPISVGGTAETTATGILALFHPPTDLSQPKAIPNTLNRDKYAIRILWSTTLPASASTVPETGKYAYRIQIFNAYLTSVKPSYDDKMLSVEVTFKWSPFQKDATRNKVEESTDDSTPLPAVTAYT